ncbi:hypothetical protein R3X45_25160, partial [Salmonella enterica subsp. enterica serovar Typhimurium]
MRDCPLINGYLFYGFCEVLGETGLLFCERTASPEYPDRFMRDCPLINGYLFYGFCEVLGETGLLFCERTASP